MNNFTPINYLEENDRVLLQKTKRNIVKAKSKEELKYYEFILDSLMKKAVKEYQNKQKDQDFQHVSM